MAASRTARKKQTVPFSISLLSFAERLLGGDGGSRDWIFVHFEPRPGWDKDKYWGL